MQKRVTIDTISPVEAFPNLAHIPHIPDKLWLRGSLPPPNTKLLAVVGSRALSRYGREACEQLISCLEGYPISIISGLALGADAAAHRAALSAKLHTIAIPGSGLNDDVIGPRTNVGLSKNILAAGGALISEQEPDHIAYPFDVPSRNRLMVGIADAVLIIEAGPRSGTLITARLAGEYNRELLCVPHRIGDPHGYGANIFMRLGATHVSDSLHILEALHITPRKPAEDRDALLQKILPELTITEQHIYRTLSSPLSRDDIIRTTGIPAPHALTLLISLELKGIVKEEFGVWKQI